MLTKQRQTIKVKMAKPMLRMSWIQYYNNKKGKKMKSKTSKELRVKKHLLKHGSITPLDALNLYGSFRLSAIIHTLRHRDGLDIKTDLAKGRSNHAIYSLKS